MTSKQKEMTVENTTEQNKMQKKESAPRDEVKPAQTENTTKEGKEKSCGFREHLKVHQTNSSGRFRPTCKKTYDMISHDIMLMIIREESIGSKLKFAFISSSFS